MENIVRLESWQRLWWFLKMRQGNTCQPNEVMEERNKQIISLKKLQSIRTDENCTCYHVFTKTLPDPFPLSDNYNLWALGERKESIA